MSKCLPITVCSDGDRKKKESAENLSVPAEYNFSADLEMKKFSSDSIS